MISNDILAQLQYDNDNDIQLTSIMIAHHSNLWQYTQWPTGYSPSLMIRGGSYLWSALRWSTQFLTVDFQVVSCEYNS